MEYFQIDVQHRDHSVAVCVYTLCLQSSFPANAMEVVSGHSFNYLFNAHPKRTRIKLVTGFKRYLCSFDSLATKVNWYYKCAVFTCSIFSVQPAHSVQCYRAPNSKIVAAKNDRWSWSVTHVNCTLYIWSCGVPD